MHPLWDALLHMGHGNASHTPCFNLTPFAHVWDAFPPSCLRPLGFRVLRPLWDVCSTWAI